MSVVGKAGYKETTIGWIPKDWDESKLDFHVSKVGSGITPKGGSESYLSEGVPLIRSQNVLWGKLNLSDVAYISEEQHQRMKGSFLNPKDVLLNITGASIGRCAVLPDDFTVGNVNQHVCIIRTTETLNPYFLAHFLGSDLGQGQINRLQAGGNREGLNFQQIRGFSIGIPPVPEQEKIAAIFGAVDDKLDVIARQIAATNTLKRGLMQTLFSQGVGTQDANGQWHAHTEFQQTELGEVPAGWRYEELGSLVSFMSNGFVGTATPFYADKENGVPYFQSNNIRENRFDFKKEIYITEDFHSKQSKSNLEAGDLLTVQSGHIGTTAVVPDTMGRSNCHALIISRPNKDVLNSRFASYQLNYLKNTGGMNSIFVGSTIKHINVKDFKKFKLIVPTLAEQLYIADMIDSIEAKIDKLLSKQTHYQTLKRGLMQKLLTGEWRVKVA
ncbi:restriction endonuclease subunit S [Deefgea piscis]|uniref:restriction endonuclease subunit S n=1 Tax=Deefgea piscis TaxID=2739061 RepID=UPI001C804459|nr:restriction endonuclease subunit S [Deefgea piscis]QZA80687.1 restriction endonuclease subunit S [Deefgea piscis]